MNFLDDEVLRKDIVVTTLDTALGVVWSRRDEGWVVLVFFFLFCGHIYVTTTS